MAKCKGIVDRESCDGVYGRWQLTIHELNVLVMPPASGNWGAEGRGVCAVNVDGRRVGMGWSGGKDKAMICSLSGRSSGRRAWPR